jgi:hypothetical protein
MRIINTFDKIQNCYTDNKFNLDAWRKYTKEFSCELSKKCEQDSKEYDFNKQIFPIVNNVLLNKDAALRTNTSFISVTNQLKSNINKLFKNDIDLDIILYLGLCNGAGWATALDGRNTILLGIEKIIELNWQNEADMQALIFHEIGHIWHKTYGVLYPKTQSKGEESLVQMYQEGIAMVCEHILCQNNNYYHQNKNDWLTWCKDNKLEIKQEYLNRIDNNISTQDFFGDWCNYKGHSDVGYYLGCEFVKHLQQRYSLFDIANLNINQLYEQYKTFALLA